MSLSQDGYITFGAQDSVVRWAATAYRIGRQIAADPEQQKANLRHGQTWFVGVDAVPNDPDGALSGVPLTGPWDGLVPERPQHRAQLSIIYPGYPRQDPDESTPNHRYRKTRAAAHVDGLLPVGPDRRRYALEYHAYILGIPLNTCTAAPTVVWAGSHKIIAAALRDALAGRDPAKTDITDAYQAARRAVFESCPRVALQVKPGESFLIHRHALHGTLPWNASEPALHEGRMIAFLRPECATFKDWLPARP